jgi:hypothetical protein
MTQRLALRDAYSLLDAFWERWEIAMVQAHWYTKPPCARGYRSGRRHTPRWSERDLEQVAAALSDLQLQDPDIVAALRQAFVMGLGRDGRRFAAALDQFVIAFARVDQLLSNQQAQGA